MSVKFLFSIIYFGNFTMDFSSERSIMEDVLIELEAVYEICN